MNENFTYEYLSHARLWSNMQTATMKILPTKSLISWETRKYCPSKITRYTVYIVQQCIWASDFPMHTVSLQVRYVYIWLTSVTYPTSPNTMRKISNARAGLLMSLQKTANKGVTSNYYNEAFTLRTLWEQPPYNLITLSYTYSVRIVFECQGLPNYRLFK